MVTHNREAVQTPASATSKWGLGTEARAALLRVRTGPEWLKSNLREVTWDSKPDCGIATTRESLNLRHRQAHSQNKGPSRVNLLLTSPSTIGDWQVRAARVRRGQSQPQRGITLPNCKQASLLTKTSWDSGWSTSAGRVAARDQLPRRDTRHTWECAPVVHPENRAAGTGEAISCRDHTCQTPGHLSGSDLGRAQNAVPTESVPLRSTWVPEPERLRPGKCIQPRAGLREFLAEQPRA